MIRRREPAGTPMPTPSTAPPRPLEREPYEPVTVPMPAPQPPAPAAPAPAKPALHDQSVTVIGSGARLEGNLVSAASLRIEGSVKGQISADGDVMIAPDAEVAADISAANVIIGGRYNGNATASGTLELTGSAKVEGNISCQSLVVSAGATFSGKSQMGTKGAAHQGSKNASKPAEAPAAVDSPPENPPPGKG